MKLVESWGSDESIVTAARMSTDKGFLGWGPKHTTCGGMLEDFGAADVYYCRVCDVHPEKGSENVRAGDEKLLRYLYENKHHTPFEMAGLIIEVQAPIFCFREWHRHRTQSYNEMSARYTPLPDKNYVPAGDRLLINSETNKQAGRTRGAGELTAADAEEFQNELIVMYGHQEEFYQKWLTRGVPKELARIDLPVGRYSKMRASANLRNWLAFMTLRAAPSAQYEIRVYAEAIGTIIKELFPRTWELFVEGRA